MIKYVYTWGLGLLLSLPAHAEPIADKLGIELEAPKEESTWDKGKGLLRKAAKWAKYIPGVGSAASAVEDALEGDLEEKVDRIEQKQDTAMDQLQRIAKKALDTKNKVEEMYYFKRRSQQRAEELARGLKQSKPKKLLGAVLEDFLGIPINPAEYIPDTEYTRDLKRNLATDLSLERDFIQRSGYLLKDTRAALAEQGLERYNYQQFSKEYSQAEAYEAEVRKALQAKQQATLKLYQKDIERLDKEIVLLEKAKEKKGLTVSDVMQIEQTIELKRGVVRDLHEKVNQGIAEGMELTEAQEKALLAKKAYSDTQALEDYFTRERKRIRQKHGHLWKF